MTDIPPSLTAFRGVRDLDQDQRLRLGEDKQVQGSGTQHRVNVFARAWDFLTRSSEEVDANKEVAREFIRGIREAYGDEVAGMASRELKLHLQEGRPLTARRVERLLEKSQQMAGRTEAGNREVLGRALDSIVDSGVKRAFNGMVNESVLGRDEQREIVQRAIESDPAFRETSFHTPMHLLVEQLGGGHEELAPLDHGFVDRFVPIATRALQRAAEEKLLPNTVAILGRDGNPGVTVRDEMLVHQPARLGLTDEQSMCVQMTTMQVRAITDSLVGGSSPLGVLLGQIGMLRDHLSEENPGGEPRMRDLVLDGRAREYRDALLEDMRALERTIGGSIGFDTLSDDARKALLGAYLLSSEVEGVISEGSLRPLGDAGPENLARLREDLQALEGLEPGDERTRALLDTVRSQAGRVLALLAAAEGAKAQGVTLEDIAAMRKSGFDVTALLSRISDSGFDSRDIARMRELGLDIGETVVRFTGTEARLLRESGLGIELGLQYKDRGVPIHPRTLVREYRDERVDGEPRLLGGGALTKPYEVSYDGRRMVFKEARPGEGLGPQSTLLGIDARDPRMAVRNVATKALDELLRFDVVPETKMGTLGGRLGVVMDFAPGATPETVRSLDITEEDSGRNLLDMQARFPEDIQGMLDAAQARIENGRVIVSQHYGVTDFDFTQPGLRRDLVKLQLLDALTAQGDRHPGNYVVELDELGGYRRLRAIDNDQAFGGKVVNPNELLHIAGGAPRKDIDGQLFGNESFNGVLLPPIVDTDMKKAFERITPEMLRGELTGLLPEREIEAAILRLGAIKAHLDRLERAGMVIEPGQWGSEKATEALQDRTRSYVGRESSYITTLEPIRYEEVRK